MIVYIVKSAIILGILYSCYFIMLNKETFHRFNRMVLITIMLLSFGLPLVKTYTDKPSVVNTEIYDIQSRIETPIYYKTAVIVETQEKVSWGEILLIVYYTGVAISILFVVIQAIGLIQYMRGGLCHTDSKGNTVILKSGEISPFSIFHYIVMSVEDYEHNRTSILTHEQEHIRLHHSYDLILLELVKTLQWFNPFVWFLASNLRSVHEYEADEAVINQGIDAKQYQQLLVTKAVGNRLQPFANNLRRGSLKKRIIMMYQKKSNRWMMLKALFVIPVAAFTICAFATPNLSTPVENVLTQQNESGKEKTDIVSLEKLNPEMATSVTVQNKSTAIHVPAEQSKNEGDVITAIKTEAENEDVKEDTLKSTFAIEDIVSRIPGATIGSDGSIYINGKKAKKLLINGIEQLDSIN